MVPRTLYLPSGRMVPVCVIKIEPVQQVLPTPGIPFPLNNIGGGNPIITDVQGRQHVATISCLVTDGHRTYALTNRHVVGDKGEVVYSRLKNQQTPIGRSSGKQLTRLPFADVYQDCPGKDVYLNLDAGLVDKDDLSAWTAQVHGIGTLGMLADLPPSHMKRSLVGSRVVGFGAASGLCWLHRTSVLISATVSCVADLDRNIMSSHRSLAPTDERGSHDNRKDSVLRLPDCEGSQHSCANKAARR